MTFPLSLLLPHLASCQRLGSATCAGLHSFESAVFFGFERIKAHRDEAPTFDPLMKDFSVSVALQPRDDRINTCPIRDALKVPCFSTFTGPAVVETGGSLSFLLKLSQLFKLESVLVLPSSKPADGHTASVLTGSNCKNQLMLFLPVCGERFCCS